jgi:hypothetical protein
MSPTAPSNALRYSCRHFRSLTQNRSLSSQCLRITSNPHTNQSSRRRWQSTDAAAAAPVNPRISGIVDQISQLTLLETADLVQSLKVNICPLLICDDLSQAILITAVSSQHSRHIFRPSCLRCSSPSRRRPRGRRRPRARTSREIAVQHQVGGL